MKEDRVTQNVTRLAKTMAKAFGLTVWGVDYLPAGKRSVLRIYMEAPDGAEAKPGSGILLDQCAEFSRHLSVALDAEDVVPGAYTLEVSSPGLERVFFKPEQLDAFADQEIEVKLYEALDTLIEDAGDLPDNFIGRKRFKGMFRGRKNDIITLEVQDHGVDLAWEWIQRAQRVYRFDKPKPGKGKGRSS